MTRAALRSRRARRPRCANGYLEQDGIGVGRVSRDRSRYWVIGAAAIWRSTDSPATLGR